MAEETKEYLYDMHAHLDYAPKPVALASELEARGVRTLSCTVQPPSFARASRELHASENVRVAAGLHPWWTADATGSAGSAILRVNSLIEYLAITPYVGEIGLDFREQYVNCRDIQLVVFEDILYASGKIGGKTISIHCIGAYTDLFDLAEKTGALENNTLIIHHFCGSCDELHRAIEMGFYFSVSEEMLDTGKGAEYAKVIPADRLLLETDAPDMPVVGKRDTRETGDIADAMTASLKNTLVRLEEIRGESLAAQIAETSARLLMY